MSVPKRVSDEAEEFVSNSQQSGEDWIETLDRLLGVGDNPDYITEEEAEELVERKIEEYSRR